MYVIYVPLDARINSLRPGRHGTVDTLPPSNCMTLCNFQAVVDPVDAVRNSKKHKVGAMAK